MKKIFMTKRTASLAAIAAAAVLILGVIAPTLATPTNAFADRGHGHNDWKDHGGHHWKNWHHHNHHHHHHHNDYCCDDDCDNCC
jgi:hypothetical protein